MLIAHCFQALVALLGLAAVFQQVKSQEHYNDTLIDHRMKRSPRGNKHRHAIHSDERPFFHGRYYPYSHNRALKFDPGQMLLPRQNKQLLDYEYGLMGNQGPGVDCCPSVIEMVEPEGGKNDQDIYVELYKSDNYRQRFFEVSCHKDVLNKPCRFMDKKIHQSSKCVQQHTFTYALVKDTPDHRNKNLPTFPGADAGNKTYTLDYISVRSGCSCMVTPNNTRRNQKKHKDKVHKKKHAATKNVPVFPETAIDRSKR
ncbi:uncharacterized protein LOC109540843 isoform X1 [Dendroctonus ponderosae]|uniref:Spaetzle domain-containing protein n=2 Tax=Dendroctonus ponderosae TaxID=77166 RepID=A0AAR5PV51_DENPD|nr:uncharacterized protein LOC109540843 isoform X1 [Dendroctonus ponderosae]XP_048526016.1 uncharacterized protein LOC109540843 isoform X1 [Dendroctonus ponderosae]XP_048526021.1 uncharacterized protein LOC109540843 isoform X1 [Dendroctonus ponderosae]KAH1028251.1 hypothetical protein HUJ05_001626 [Dendroctonus ponderosae]